MKRKESMERKWATQVAETTTPVPASGIEQMEEQVLARMLQAKKAKASAD
jgi:hypothetical protein